MNKMNVKICSICDLEKPISNFRKDSSSPEGIGYWCKECSKIYINEYFNKFPWLKSYYCARGRCNYLKDKWYHQKGIRFFLTKEEIKEIWFRDKAYLMKKPSIDRINDLGHYVITNVRFIELSENCKKNKTKTIAQYTLDGKLIKIWNSIAEARRTLKISGGNICEAVNGRRNQASGYRWIYA